MATFITSKAVGGNITIDVQTSTGFWKYNHDGSDSGVFLGGNQTITVANANGEFTIIPCLSDGTVSGNITTLYLSNNQLTSFDGTGLTSLTFLNLDSNQFTSFDGTGLTSLTFLSLQFNQLTSFDGTGLTSLTNLDLDVNQLTSLSGFIFPTSLTTLELNNNRFTSFDGTGLSSLITLNLNNNQLTSFDGTDLSSLTYLQLGGNQLTSFDGTDLSSLTNLNLTNNLLTPSDNDQIINQLNQNGLWGGQFYSEGGRTSASNVGYDNLISSEWSLGGLDLAPTFITSKAVGETINVYVNTSTGYWKYNHDGSDSSVKANGTQTLITVTNANGEFVIISCDSDGIVSGDINFLSLNNNQLTSFDGSGLSSLTGLYLNENQLTSFDGAGLTSLTGLYLSVNQLTSFDGTGLSSLTMLSLNNNQLTSFDGTGLTSLTNLELGENQLTSFDGTGLSSLTYLFLQDNQLTSFYGTGLTSLTGLYLDTNQLTSFDGTGLTSLTMLSLNSNLLTSFDGTGLTSLTNLELLNNQLTSFDGTGLSGLQELDFTNNLFTSFDPTGLTSLTGLNLEGNPLTPSSNNQILNQLNQNGLSDGYFESNNGRTSESNDDYDNLLNNLGWVFSGLYLSSTPPTTFITSKAVGQTITIYVTTSTGFWRYNHGGGDSSVFTNTGGRRGRDISITNSNGEFAIISCDSGGNVSGDITHLNLQSNQITSFYPTGLSGLTWLSLSDNPLTSFDGTGLSGLTYLSLTGPKNGGVGSLTSVSNLSTILTYLNLSNNQLTSFDVTGLVSLTELYLSVNPLTPSVNNQILNQFNQNGLSDGYFSSFNGRTSASNVDYDNLISLGWTFEGLDVVIPPTFITSKAVGQDIIIGVQTSTGFWKYNHNGSDSIVSSNGDQIATVTNANGEFTIISCLSDGTVSGDVIELGLQNNLLTSFDGTGLTSLTYLGLNTNQLTSFDGTDLSSLTTFGLNRNQLTSFNGTGLTSLTSLDLNENQLTSFDGTDLSSLTYLSLLGNQLTSFNPTGLTSLDGLYLQGNQLTSIDVSSLTSLTHLQLQGNQLTSSVNNQTLNLLDQYGLSDGYFSTSNGRTADGTADYDSLISKGWTIQGANITLPVTFITSNSIGQIIQAQVQTTTGFCKYNHDGSDSSVFVNGSVTDQFGQYLTTTNANGEFTLISCDESGNVSGDVTWLSLSGNQLTSFDGTGLTSLTFLSLSGNQLTSFDGTMLTNVTQLDLYDNQLTSFDSTGLSSLTALILYGNQLTSFDGTGLSSLTDLELNNNQLTSFDGTGLSNLTWLRLDFNQLTSFDVTGLSGLIYLGLNNNQLTSSVNNQILQQLNQNGLSGGEFYSTNGRTSASNADYDNLVSLGWTLEGLDLITVGNRRCRYRTH